MPTVKFISNNNKEIEVDEGANLLRASIRYQGNIPFKCGGGICGTCKVLVEEGKDNLDKVKKHEYKHIDEEMVSQGYRMACQTSVEGDISISWEDPKLRKEKK